MLSAPAGRRTFPTLSLQVFRWMPRPLPRWVSMVLLPVSSHRNIGLLPVQTRSAFPQCPIQQLQYGALSRSYSHSLMFRPPTLLATQVAPTAMYDIRVVWCVRFRVRWSFQGFRLGPQSDSHSDTSDFHPLHRAAVTFTSEQYTSRYLPVLRIC